MPARPLTERVIAVRPAGPMILEVQAEAGTPGGAHHAATILTNERADDKNVQNDIRDDRLRLTFSWPLT
jgi:hypothetical protein